MPTTNKSHIAPPRRDAPPGRLYNDNGNGNGNDNGNENGKNNGNDNGNENGNGNENNNQPEKFKKKYRIQSARLQGYDYSSNGAYFITICTKNREHFFGDIVDGEMQLSDMGKIVAEEWMKTAEIRKNVKLGEWVIMPNHFHAVVILDNDEMVETPRNEMVETPRRGVSTGWGVSTGGNHKPQWKSGCLGAIINQFKSKCTKRIWKFSKNFAWQPRFHDHIIRNEPEFFRITEYIVYNPINWNTDCFFNPPQ